MTAAAKALGFKKLEPWMANLKNKDLHNGALVAVDYETGELVAYVGSADYYATSSKKNFQPQFDVVGNGYRQPGSAFKPFNYAVGINDKTITAGTMLMDVGTDFGGGYTPNDADRLERGPVRVRNALQFSLNIPAVKTLALNTADHVYAKAQEFGMDFQGERKAELALALGVQEVRPVDLVTAYGTLANGGKEIPHTSILAINDANGKPVKPPYVPPAGKQVISPQAAFIVTDILAGNTNKNINPYWGKFSITGPDGRRPATLKTGTNNDAKDLNAYGYIAPPTDKGRSTGAYALAVGVWNGNSDNSLVSTARSPLFSIDVSTYVWQGFLNEATKKWPETNFKRPADGLVQAKIDPWTGQLATSDKLSVNEWFIAGTQPKSKLASDQCGIDVVVHVNVETRFDGWLKADRDWLRRADRGPGVVGGPDRTRTAYFYQGGFHPYGASWGALVGGRLQACPDTELFRRAHAGCRRSRAVVRTAEPGRLRAGGTPLPARKPERVAERAAVGRAVRPAERGATADAGADTGADTRTNARADPGTDSGADAGADPNASGATALVTDAVVGPVGDGEPSTVVEVRDLMVRRGERTILGPLDWTIRTGERWVVIGPNGSGQDHAAVGHRAGTVADGRRGRRARRAVRPGRCARDPPADRRLRQLRRGHVPGRPDPDHPGHDRAVRGDRAVVARLHGRGPRAGDGPARRPRPGGGRPASATGPCPRASAGGRRSRGP